MNYRKTTSEEYAYIYKNLKSSHEGDILIGKILFFLMDVPFFIYTFYQMFKNNFSFEAISTAIGIFLMLGLILGFPIILWCGGKKSLKHIDDYFYYNCIDAKIIKKEAHTVRKNGRNHMYTNFYFNINDNEIKFDVNEELFNAKVVGDDILIVNTKNDMELELER